MKERYTTVISGPASYDSPLLVNKVILLNYQGSLTSLAVI